MMLALGVSKRILPSLERHMRDADCAGGPPAAGSVFVAQSEQNGGGVDGICGTAGVSLARNRDGLYRVSDYTWLRCTTDDQKSKSKERDKGLAGGQGSDHRVENLHPIGAA
jgi:hypothetical protein